MSALPPEDLAEFHFSYPRKPWVLMLFCHLLIFVLFCTFYYNAFSGEFVEVYWGGIIVYLIVVSTWIWEWPVLILNRGKDKGIVLHENGITVNGNFAEWGDLVRIDHGPFFFWRHTMVLLRLKREGGSFWSFDSMFKPWLPPLEVYPFICTDVIPAIMTIRPDIPVSPVVMRMLDQPAKAGGMRTWLVLTTLSLYIAILSTLLLVWFRTIIPYLAVGGILVALSVPLPNFCVPVARTARERFVECTLQCQLFVGFAIKMHPWSVTGQYALETIVGTAVVMCVIAIFVVLAMEKFSCGTQVFVAVLLLLTVPSIYFHGKSKTWPVTDISYLMPDDESATLVWGRSGIYAASNFCTDMTCIIRISDLSEVELPEHKGENRVVWLDRSLLIRRIHLDREPMQLFVYDFASRSEGRIPTAHKFSVSFLQPVSPDVNFLAWVDKGADGDTDKLRVWDLHAMREAYPPRDLPAATQWSYGNAGWVKNNEIVVLARKQTRQKEKKRQYALHMVRVNLKTGAMEYFSSSHKYEKWYPTPDFLHAFGVNKKASGHCDLWLVNLLTDRAIKLRSGYFPLILPTSDLAFRVAECEGRLTLMRIDIATGSEHPLYVVPAGMTLAGLSGDGKLALLVFREFMSLPQYILQHIPSGRQHRFQVPGVTTCPFSGKLNAVITGFSPFSPDGRLLALQALDGECWRIYLVRIPADWPE